MSRLNQPCFCASSWARCLFPIPTNAWTTADHVGVTLFCHSSNISIRRLLRSLGWFASMIFSSSSLIPRWRPRGIQSMTSYNSQSRSRTSGTGHREDKLIQCLLMDWAQRRQIDSVFAAYNYSIGRYLPTVRLACCEVSLPAELETTHR